MTRHKAVIVVSVFALVFAGVAAWLTHSYLQREVSSLQAVQPQKIVVAAADIPIGATIREEQLKVTTWPKDSIPAGSMQSAAAAAGRVAIRPIAGGDAVTELKLKPKGSPHGSGFMTYVIPPGHRAVTVAVNEVAGVAGFLTPNDRVDVVVTTKLDRSDNDRKEITVSKIILENVAILATGDKTEQKDGKPVLVPTVTLDLLPSDAEKLVLGANKGTLQLLLRNIADSGVSGSQGATIEKVLSGMELPLPKPAQKAAEPKRHAEAKPKKIEKPVQVVKAAPPPTFTLEIVRGTDKTVKHYTE